MADLQDEIHLHNPNTTHRPSKGLLVYFITGNPGLIAYYKPFLTHLHKNLLHNEAEPPHTDIHVYGASFPGFEVNVQPCATSSPSPSPRSSAPPYSLRAQIANVTQRLRDKVSQIAPEYPDGLSVVLAGHSVGAYIMMELAQTLASTPLSHPSHLTAMIGLFPTVVDIVQSPKGRKLGPLLGLSFLPGLAAWLTYLLFGFLPFTFLTKLITTLLGHPPHAARATAAFLQSRYGVKQALYMAADEMREICDDKWSDELWNTSRLDPGTSSGDMKGREQPDVYFYWGVDDHWVSDRTRDELIRTRGLTGNRSVKDRGVVGGKRVVMEVDNGGTPHGFCIEHSEAIARKVAGFIGETMRAGKCTY